jgi:hypothetical protein
MADAIMAGTILIEDGTAIPDSMVLKRVPYSNGWASLMFSCRELEREINKAHWNLFYIASDIKTNAFGFDRQKNLRTAVDRVITAVKANHCNCLEIQQVTPGSFFRLPYVTVTAHSRHIQESNLFTGVAESPR